MDSGSFQLKRSCLALLFQLAVFTALMALLYQLLPLSFWCAFLALGAAAYLLFYRGTPQVILLIIRPILCCISSMRGPSR